MKQIFLAVLAALASVDVNAHAQSITSEYTKLDVGPACTQFEADEIGASFTCPGFKSYGVLFSEYDLRTSIFYGYVGEWYAEGAWESFPTFNSVGDTIEWRVHDGIPRATIFRWFVEHMDPETGAPSDATRGQVLVISKVAQPGSGDGCVMAYVDARANSDANVMARDAADRLLSTFRCRVDEPQYIGDVGPFAGDPSRTFGP
ncbi:MAG: hypothetical protein AAGG69_09230 [Pseudomonadota bacterium]